MKNILDNISLIELSDGAVDSLISNNVGNLCDYCDCDHYDGCDDGNYEYCDCDNWPVDAVITQ